MNCIECGAKMRVTRENVRDRSCGLPNVVLGNVEVRRCPECGAVETVIPKIEDLHRLLAERLAKKPGPLTGEEIRFLRKFLGWSGEDFAEHMGVTPEAVSRWENKKKAMGPVAERLLRLCVVQQAPVKDYALDELSDVGTGRKAALKIKGRVRNQEWELAPA